jgi:hypothetical protein
VIESEARFSGPGRFVVEDKVGLYLRDEARVDVPILNEGMLSIENSGDGLAIIQSLEQRASGQLAFFANPVLGRFPATLNVSLAAVIDGALAIESFESFETLRPGTVFELLKAEQGIAGRFASYDLPELRQGLFWRIDYDPQSVSVEVVNLLQGDYDGNDAVEQGDLDLVLLNWGEGAAVPPDLWVNDLPSGIVDQEELDRVLLGWGDLAVRPAAGAVVGAPEPTTWALGLVIALCGPLIASWRRPSYRR